MRVGTEPNNQGSTIEWNPAFPDTFAVSSSDFSLLVAKIDVNDPTKQKYLGAKKLGAEATVISWSPKGKQLTIGDSVGKVVQLKPELDIVRCTMPPENPKNIGKVTGLCWLSTTEWMVSYANNENQTNHETYLMKCKKDKPTEWIKLFELSYSNDQSALEPRTLTANELLVEWNVILVGNTKIGQVIPIGKMTNDWQTWTVDEGTDINLPIKQTQQDSFPVGIVVDRSANEMIQLEFGPDAKAHNPAPIVMCLTDDGLLTAYHVVSTNPTHKPYQIKCENLAINGVGVVQQQQQQPATVTPEIVTPKPVEPVKAQKAPPPPIPKIAPVSAIGQQVQQQAVITPTQKVVVEVDQEALEEERIRKEESERKKREIMELVTKVAKSIMMTKDGIGELTFGIQSVRKSVTECAQVVQESVNESKEVIDELKQLMKTMTEQSEKLTHTIKEMDFELEEKMEFVIDKLDVDGEDPARIVEALRDVYESEKLMRFNKLETQSDMLKEKLAECNETLKILKIELKSRESTSKTTVLSPLRMNIEQNRFNNGAEAEMALKVMRNVTKIILDVREKLTRNELEWKLLLKEREKKMGQRKTAGEDSILVGAAAEAGKEEEDVEIGNAEILKTRQRILEKAQKRGPVKMKKVKIQSYQVLEKFGEMAMDEKKNESMNVDNLSNALLRLSQTPRKVMTTSMLIEPAGSESTGSTKRDATTQADEPRIVEKVVVTVESKTPAAAPPAAPIFSSPQMRQQVPVVVAKPPPPVVVKQEEPKTPPTSPKKQQQPQQPQASSFFTGGGGKLFGSTMFGGGGAVKKEEVPEAAAPVKEVVPPPPPPPPVKEEEKVPEPVVEVVEEERTPEPQKQEEKVETPKKKEEQEASAAPSATSTPSFTFVTPSTQKPTPTQSIFSGATAAAATVTPKPSTGFFGSSTGGSPAFGAFGQAAQPVTAAPAQPGGGGGVSFSFNAPSSSTTPSAAGSSGVFGGSQPKPVSGFAAAAAVAAADSGDVGMEDDSSPVMSSSSIGGGGGFMSGLGAAKTSGGSTNIFGSKPAQPAGGGSANSWLFGGGSGSAAKPATPAAAASSFSFAGAAAAAAATTQPAQAFGGAPKFGGQPAFGGAAGGQQQMSKTASIFGGSGGGGFSQFSGSAAGGSALFGGGSSAVKPTAASSIFGGSSQPGSGSGGAAGGSSIFGGGGSVAPSKFNQWR